MFKSYTKKEERGFVSAIILIVIAFILLKIFVDFDIIEFLKKYINQENLVLIKNWFTNLFDNIKNK